MQRTLEPPGASQDSLYIATDISPEQIFQAIGRLRKDARDEIDRLIRFLDASDDYVSRELEDEIDAGPCDTDELEISEGDDEPDGDREPSLGSLDGKDDQTAWAAGKGGDAELDPAESGIG